MHNTLRRGTVYGTLLNHADALAALGAAVHAPPYKVPPKAPVLYIKPRNTWAADGDAIVVPAGVDELEIGATLGLVIGLTACRVHEQDALSFVAGCVIVNDVSVPHASYYRPSLRFKARDGFCPIGPFVARERLGSLDTLQLQVEVDGVVVHRSGTAGLIRPPARLLAEVSEFMTLSPGDVLMLGVAAGAPRARAGQRVSILIDGLGRLDNPLVAEEVSA
ncbi:MAG: fumarylacetoacetate hydrolase family protein [Burkholderiales bacterium]|nr:fumarylacetoacetate hydrolase family protein [Burkholderiales bacterium]